MGLKENRVCKGSESAGCGRLRQEIQQIVCRVQRNAVEVQGSAGVEAEGK